MLHPGQAVTLHYNSPGGMPIEETGIIVSYIPPDSGLPVDPASYVQVQRYDMVPPAWFEIHDFNSLTGDVYGQWISPPGYPASIYLYWE